jgi:uncharacterized protein (DUF58 family)
VLWLISLSILAIWFWPTLWYRVVKNHLELDVEIHGLHIEQGQEAPITIRIRNRAWLPCPSLQLRMELPEGLAADAEGLRSAISLQTYIFARQELIVETVCYGIKRGLHELSHRDAILMVNEGLGMKTMYISRSVPGVLVVLPRYQEASIRPLAAKAMLGRMQVMRWLQPDETLLRGIRPYQAGDDVRSIAWRATARTGELMTKQFSTSTDHDVVLVLNAQMYDPMWSGVDSQAIDHLCACAVTWAAFIETQGMSCALASNAVNPGLPSQWWYGRQRARGIREALGRVRSVVNRPFDQLLQSIEQRLAQSSYVLFFLDFLTPSQSRRLVRLAYRQQSIAVVTSRLEVAAKLGQEGVTVLHVPQEQMEQEA